MQVGANWEQLSHSSKQAMQWAWAAARHRVRGSSEDPKSAEVGGYDLLLGLMVAPLCQGSCRGQT